MSRQTRSSSKQTETTSTTPATPGLVPEGSSESFQMPPVLDMVAERKREEETLRALREMEQSSSEGAESESDVDMARALEALRRRSARAAAAPASDAFALLPRLVAAMQRRRADLLHLYLALLAHHDYNHTHHHVRAATDQVMRCAEKALSEGTGGRCGGCGGEERCEWAVHKEHVVLCGWLALATVWRAPRVPRAALLLRRAAAVLDHHEAEELTRALVATLPAGELLQLSDATSGDLLSGYMLRAALAKICGHNAVDVPWGNGAPNSAETVNALCGCWPSLDLAHRAHAARLAGRALALEVAAAGAGAARGAGGAAAGGAGGAAGGADTVAGRGERVAALLDAHRRPSGSQRPDLRHEPEFLKVIIALSKLKVIFNPEEPKVKNK